MLNRFSELLVEEFQRQTFSGLTAEICDKYFTNDDIKGLIAFYETPIGRKAIGLMPAVSQESIKRGAELGQTAAARAASRLVTEYPELKNVLK